ncbi:MAG: type IV secretory system conjugative DNA transfer family protein [Steroidobacteraceae bacterium]
MSLTANAVAWAPRVKPRWPVLAIKAIAIAGVCVIASQYLAGFLWAAWNRQDPRTVGPFTIARYAYYYGEVPTVRRRLWVSSAGGLALIAFAALPLLLPRRRALHGDARFSTRAEMSRAGLFAKHGLFLGRVGRRYLILGGQQGVLLSAPPRAEKGTAIVIPNLLFWQGSVLCLDVKLENWTLTAGYRQRAGQSCYLFHPLAEDGNTACWNPLTYISTDPNLRISDVQRIAAILYPDVPGTDPFWPSGARSYFLGVTMYVLETPTLPPTLGEVLRQGMASDTEGFGHHWRRIIEGRQKGRHPLSSPCVRALSEIIDLAPVTASSIRKTFTSRLDLFANPLLDRATSRNDFDLRDLRKRPMSIYLAINPGDLHLLQALLNLFIEQALNLQTRELPEHNPALKLQVAFILDELAAAGRIPILAQGVAYLPGYNVRLMLVIQAFSQLREIYGQQNAETMMKSLAARIVYAPKDVGEATEISQELGFTTVKVNTHSRPLLNVADPKHQRQRSVSVSEQKRPLLLPQEVKELGKDKEILFYEGVRPILGQKNRYYRDPLFRQRLFPPPRFAVPGGRPPKPSATPDGSVSPKRAASPANEIVAGSVAAAEPSKPDALAVTQDGSPAESEPLTREATLADVDRIESITLEEYAVDFGRLTVPEGRLSAEDTKRLAENFVQAFHER